MDHPGNGHRPKLFSVGDRVPTQTAIEDEAFRWLREYRFFARGGLGQTPEDLRARPTHFGDNRLGDTKLESAIESAVYDRYREITAQLVEYHRENPHIAAVISETQASNFGYAFRDRLRDVYFGSVRRANAFDTHERPLHEQIDAIQFTVAQDLAEDALELAVFMRVQGSQKHMSIMARHSPVVYLSAEELADHFDHLMSQPDADRFKVIGSFFNAPRLTARNFMIERAKRAHGSYVPNVPERPALEVIHGERVDVDIPAPAANAPSPAKATAKPALELIKTPPTR